MGGVDKPVLSTPFPCFLSFRGGSQMFFLLVSGFSPFFSSLTSPGNPHLFSAEQVGCGSSYARFPGASTALAHTLPLPQEPSFFFYYSFCSLPGSKLPPLPELQTLFSYQIRRSPAALY